MQISFDSSLEPVASSSNSIGDHGYREQIDAAVSELLMLERDAAWTYHSVKQNVLISQLNGAPLSSSVSLARAYGGYLADDGRKEFQKVRGQGIVHAPPETTFNCISDLDMIAMWDGTSSEQQLIAEYPFGEEGLVRILYIRFNGIFPVSSRDICVCTIKRPIMTRKQKKIASLYSTSPLNRVAHQTSENFETDAFVLTAFSIDHPSCPPTSGYIRAELRASGFIIRPHANSACTEVTYILQFNAKGWLPTALASMVSEYQPLRIAKIRDIAHTYQNESSKSSSLPDSSTSSTSTARFSWMQQCRGTQKEEEEFISNERQRLEEASIESSRSKLRPLRHQSSSNSLFSVSKSSSLQSPTLRHHRSASSGSYKMGEATSSGRRLSYGSSDTLSSVDSSRSSPKRRGSEMLRDGSVIGEGEGGETEWSDGRSRVRAPLALRPRVSIDSDLGGFDDSDVEDGVSDADSTDSTPFYDACCDTSPGALLEPGTDTHLVVLRMLNNDVDHIKGVQLASQQRLEAIEENLKRRSVENVRLLNHLEGLKSFLIACMDKLKVYTSEHKAMESMRMRMETKWHTKLANVAQKLSEAQRGYWNSKRARQAVMYRYSTLIFLFVVWPILFIKLYSVLQQPAKYFKKFIKFSTFIADWLFPHIPFNSDT